MDRIRINFLFLNVGHFFDHFFVLIFATMAATVLTGDWDLSYAQLIPYATPGFIAFGLCAIPAGWLADRWSRENMMTVFFVGIGASSMLASFADTPLQLSFGLLAIGAFASIYHPVALAMVVQGRRQTGIPLAINGVFGNFGIASAALITGLMIDLVGWRMAFVAPGALSVATGIAYAFFIRSKEGLYPVPAESEAARPAPGGAEATSQRKQVIRIFSVIFVSTAIGGLIFQSASFSMPKIIDERMGDFATSASLIGWYAFIVFSVASVGQLIIGYLIDRHSVRHIFILVATGQVVLFAVMREIDGVAALLVATGFMLMIFGQLPINDVLVGRISRPEWRSRIYAARYVVSFMIAATAIPFIAWMHANWGFGNLFMLLSGAAAVILLCVLTLPSTGTLIRGAPAPR
ncbi:MAG: MFS transporter [Rhodospirillaceae bacterium]|jgi:MFS family permease|nr:MFS transporter [Rhodospirillaceae bacterium]MBT3885968.1 MFS transporter [Rhodospirillaceae bacterium]MBT4115898.1 MFS transporter [Rhodospirillaceae bacterium]MBT4672608.1 MFS transporter [Rhodospirillaceae bacterium]MBT4720744.1 MFS transporter [Rhodospirillaceae bacterium]